MPPYDLINQEHFLFMMAVGHGLALLLALVHGSRIYTFSLRKRSEVQIADSVHEFGGEVSEGDGPIPIFIWLLLSGVLLWAAGYTVYSGVFGL